MADMQHSKCCGRKSVWVQVPPPAPISEGLPAGRQVQVPPRPPILTNLVKGYMFVPEIDL